MKKWKGKAENGYCRRKSDSGCTRSFWITPSMSKSIDCKYIGCLVNLKEILIDEDVSASQT